MGAVENSKASHGNTERIGSLAFPRSRFPRSSLPQATVYRFGPFVLDPAEQRLTRDGRTVAVPAKARQILLILAEADGCLVTHESLRSRLWPDVVVQDRTLTVHMSTLRKILGDGAPGEIIETVLGAGYRLAVPVRMLKRADQGTATAAHRSAMTADDRSCGVMAYFFQLQARAHLQMFARLPLLKALTLFEQALVLDPDHAMAHAGFGSAYRLMASTAMLRPLQVDEAMPVARQSAERALALDSALAEAWALRGRVKMEYDWDWDGAEADFARAIALDPGSAEAVAAHGEFLSAMGRHDEASEAMEHAHRLDPRSVETLQHLAIVCWVGGKPDRALQAVTASQAMSPDAPRAHYGRMLILDQLGRHDDAMAERLAALPRLKLAPGLADHVATVARSGNWRAAMDAWIVMLERTNRWEAAAMHWMVVGEPEWALDALEHCVETRTTYLRFTGQNPCFRPLHGNTRFRAILRTLGLDRRIDGPASGCR